MAVPINGLCPAGKATLQAHQRDLDEHTAHLNKLDGKLDRITFLLVGTLATAVTSLAYMVMQH